jgi:hypothetical protein
MTDQNQTVFPINYHFEIVGNLGHDNKLFDRTCPTCKSMYSSFQVANCPTCGAALVAITTGEGKAMSISEGTIYPAFSQKQKERNARAIANRKNGIKPVYRFKIFSFADANGFIAPPQGHDRMKSGALVKLIIKNHEIIPSWFLTRENKPQVELMMQIYPQYGDVATVLKDAQVAAHTQGVAVGPNGNPLPTDITLINKEIAFLTERINALKAAQGIPQNNTVVVPQNQMSEAEAAAFMDEYPPFEGGTQTVSTFPDDDDPLANVPF